MTVLQNVTQGLRGRKHQDTGEGYTMVNAKNKSVGMTWAGCVALGDRREKLTGFW
jgi:hypothetical protein